MTKAEFLALKPEMTEELDHVPDCAEYIIDAMGQPTVSVEGTTMKASVPINGHFEWVEADLVVISRRTWNTLNGDRI